MPGIYGIRQGDNKKKPGGKERIMGSHRANAKGYNGIYGPIYKIVQLAHIHLHPFHTFQSRSIHVLKEYVLPPWIIEVFEFQRSYSSLRS